MKQKKIVIIMAGILAAAAAMTGCAEQNKTATQVDYTQNAQGKSEQAKQKTAVHPVEKKIQIRLRIRRRKYLPHPIMRAMYRIQGMEQTVLRELIQTIPRPQGWTLLHLKIMVQQVMVVLNLIRGQIRQ